MIQRAQQWVLERVPYSQTAWWTDSLGTYRQDCSGFVSMAWHLDQRTDFWTGNLGLVSHPIAWNQLAPGDILLSSTHTVVFAGWNNTSGTSFSLYEEAHPGANARYVTGASTAQYAAGGFVPFRYNLIQDGAAPPPPSPLGAPPVVVTSPALVPPANQPLPAPPPIAWTDGGGTPSQLPQPSLPVAVSPAVPVTPQGAGGLSPWQRVGSDASGAPPAQGDGPGPAPGSAQSAVVLASPAAILLSGCVTVMRGIRFRQPTRQQIAAGAVDPPARSGPGEGGGA